MAASASELSARLYNYRDARRAGCDADVALQQTVRTRGLGTQIQLSTDDESGMGLLLQVGLEPVIESFSKHAWQRAAVLVLFCVVAVMFN